MKTSACAILTAAFLVTPLMSASAETLVERGEYLVRGIAGCGNCHTPMGPEGFIEDKELGGRLVEETDHYTAYAPNITPAGRVSEWSDEELARAIREGIRPDGSVIGPPMPFMMYRRLSDRDVESIVAFLRTIPPAENEVPKSTYNMPLPPAYGPPVESVPEIPETDLIAYGEYLAGPVAHCMECHSPIGPEGPMIETDLGRGGYEFVGPWGVTVAPNITSHEDGIAGYTDAELRKMITQGVRPDGTPMTPPMPYPFLAKMTDSDLNAIIAYLRTVPPLPDAE